MKMVKIAAILSIFIMFIANLWAANTCTSCGSECVPACGTRYYRSCCFNYLRKKRDPGHKILLQNLQDLAVHRNEDQHTKPDIEYLQFLNPISDDLVYPYEYNYNRM